MRYKSAIKKLDRDKKKRIRVPVANTGVRG